MAASPPVHILLIEDDSIDVEHMMRLLPKTHIHHQLHVVPDGESALAFLRHQHHFADAPHPDLLIVDLHLPTIDGIGLLKEIRSHPDSATIPVLIVTGSQERDDILQAYQLRSNAYLTKPYTQEPLLIAINAALEHHWFVVVKKPERE